MTDLTKITTPFGLLDPETQDALKAHGGPYEVFAISNGLGWKTGMFGNDMGQFAALVWRVKPQPLTKPSINWSHVAPEYKWLARDENGDAFVYSGQPCAYDGIWRFVGKHRMADAFASYRPGTCGWKDSLVERGK